MSNIREVARLAGVSVATVSRTLKSPERVLPETRDKVNAAVEQAGYRPNLMAVQFRSRKTANLVILVPTIANTFFARVISGAQQAAQAAGYRLLLCDTQGREEIERTFAELVYAHQADGVIQLRAYDPYDTTCSSADLPPIVNACEVISNGRHPTISLDNHAAAKAMTQHLIELGHRRIGLIKGPRSSPLTRDRVAGYLDALEQAGIEFDPALVCHGNFSLQAGYDGAGAILELPERPTALFCENDEMAIGALKRIKEHGLRVPEDLSLVGFDDIPLAAYCDPPLTTISQPAEAFGQTAVQMLIALIEKKPIEQRHIVLPFELTLRNSTAAPGFRGR
ncbi:MULTISPECIES: LacI family DNA-binding transcriptional regulator [Pseudomonas]|uniref:Transcriptional regulator n=1 Tax=Pseudomonas cichorii TaxID=36746 RepID=A0A3M4VL45_PSECI|nr:MULTISPECIES: LacI family DNA-binding transcriptional regulator [Pseudomonas]QVE19006.1 LacI family DNA-binding transcriptional regulator [Pseudomonas cichorii]RMR52580.1 Transcriptional regulator [Pseudomonas cichorii]SDN59113.1 transcriptional regulator, LacI family [Pseudomonas cichorii]GFM75568.1 DNA-binding transcriptional regulator CytR [Pseudomonas cichorii]GFM90579.1 DNA-binding transcriptional regulator CytR [Pseudomonas cichorii]